MYAHSLILLSMSNLLTVLGRRGGRRESKIIPVERQRDRETEALLRVLELQAVLGISVHTVVDHVQRAVEGSGEVNMLLLPLAQLDELVLGLG